jgi:hypothetical protein
MYKTKLLIRDIQYEVICFNTYLNCLAILDLYILFGIEFSVIENVWVECKYIGHSAGRLAVSPAVGRIPRLYNPSFRNKFCPHSFNERLHQEKEFEEEYKNKMWKLTIPTVAARRKLFTRVRVYLAAWARGLMYVFIALEDTSSMFCAQRDIKCNVYVWVWFEIDSSVRHCLFPISHARYPMSIHP